MSIHNDISPSIRTKSEVLADLALLLLSVFLFGAVGVGVAFARVSSGYIMLAIIFSILGSVLFFEWLKMGE